MEITAKRRRREDRIGKLGNDVLGHILSFLPSQEAARAAVLSTRWRDAFVGVHTLSLEEPESPIPIADDNDNYCYSPGYDSPPKDPDPPTRFTATVAAAIVARHRGPAAAPPLRALRVALNDYRNRDFRAVDQCVSYAMKHAGPTLALDLCLRRAPLRCECARYRQPVLADAVIGLEPQASLEVSGGDGAMIGPEKDGTVEDEGDDAVSSEDEGAPAPSGALPEYAVSRGLFSCAVLRSLRIGPCRLSPPPTISLPSLQELLLTRVSDDGDNVHRLISACPRLADLTLEACHTVTRLYLFDTPLHRLALRCCHNLTSVRMDASELDAFEYRGAVPRFPLLETHVLGVSGRWFLAAPLLSSCTVDICGQALTSSLEELSDLAPFVHCSFTCAKQLHLRTARIGFGIGAFAKLPSFLSLQHLELRGHLLHEDAFTISNVMHYILIHAPYLEVLSVIFETEPQIDKDGLFTGRRYECKERELLDANHLRYNPFSVINAPTATVPCLTYRVREINLVHYQGGQAQRTLAKYLLCSTPLLDRLWCQFAEGPWSIHTKLMQEMKGWVMNDKADMVFC
ncbi:unnamed protein product [Alopecurus aequalis]